MNRSYIANVINTMLGNAFQIWANERIDERNAKMVEEKAMTIEMDKEIADIFRASTAVSGKSKIQRSLAGCFNLI